MGGLFVLGGVSSSTGYHPVTAVQYEPLNGTRYTMGTLPQIVRASTLTRPTLPADAATTSYLWTVEQATSGAVSLVLREITRTSVSVPRATIAIPVAAHDEYRLSGAWDSPDTVLLSVVNPTNHQWGVFTAGEFSACRDANGGVVTASCVTLRPVVSSDAFGGGSHLFQGAYAEPQALVLPILAPDGGIGMRVERLSRSVVGTAAAISSADIQTWVK
jgi:hypothetical protein